MVAKKKAVKKRTVKAAPKKPDSTTRKKAKAAVKKVITKKKKAVTKRKTRATTKKKVATKKATTKKTVKRKAPTTKKKTVAHKKRSTSKKKVATKRVSTAKKRTTKAKVTPKKATTEKKTVKAPVKKKAPTRRRTTNYLNNRDMLAEVIQSKKDDYPTPTLSNMFMLLVARYGKKYSYANYTYNDDMQAYALMMLVKTWRSFKPEKSSNPFAFFTQCIKNSFIQYLNQERKQRNIRDEMLVDKGLTPSYTFQLAHEQKSRERHESDDEAYSTDHVGVGEAREEPTV